MTCLNWDSAGTNLHWTSRMNPPGLANWLLESCLLVSFQVSMSENSGVSIGIKNQHIISVRPTKSGWQHWLFPICKKQINKYGWVKKKHYYTPKMLCGGINHILILNIWLLIISVITGPWAQPLQLNVALWAHMFQYKLNDVCVSAFKPSNKLITVM